MLKDGTTASLTTIAYAGGSVQGSPIQDIRVMRQIRFVMKDGVRYDTLSWR